MSYLQNAFTTVIISHCYGQVDHIIESHPAYGELQNEAETRSVCSDRCFGILKLLNMPRLLHITLAKVHLD